MIQFIKELIEEGNIFGAMAIILSVELIFIYIMYQLLMLMLAY